MREIIEELHSVQDELVAVQNELVAMEDELASIEAGLRDLGFTPPLIEDLKQGKLLTGVSIKFTDPPLSTLEDK